MQPIKDKWAHFESEMNAAKLQTTSVAYRLELCRVPVFSSEQSRTHVENLQVSTKCDKIILLGKNCTVIVVLFLNCKVVNMYILGSNFILSTWEYT